MNVDAILHGDLSEAANTARRAEALGFDGVVSPEVAHDPFLPIALSAVATDRVTLTTGIAVAFARSPMNVAVTASDLHRLTDGRFVLGLGTQIKAHITRRFSMPWSHPAARMREFVTALRAIWASWQDGTSLNFNGDFYQHTLMTPMFDHGPSEYGTPPVYLAAVGPGLTAVAGEVADGLLAHGFTTPSYFRDVTAVHLERGLATSGRQRSDIVVSMPLMSVIGRNDEEIEAGLAGARMQVAFYGSTPAYRPVLDHHGWGDLGVELNRLSKLGEWDEMGNLIDPEVLEQFVTIGRPDEIADQTAHRWGDLIDRVQIGLNTFDTDSLADFITAAHALPAPESITEDGADRPRIRKVP